MDKAFLKIYSDILFLLLNLEIDFISWHDRQNEEKKSIMTIDQCFSKLT